MAVLGQCGRGRISRLRSTATRPARSFRSRSKSATVAPCGASRRSPLAVIARHVSIPSVLPYGLYSWRSLLLVLVAKLREGVGGHAIGNAGELWLGRVWLRSAE